ncbi:MAG: hypothetical protein ACRDD7_08260 [Peptostreptococcaceae bacterium]
MSNETLELERYKSEVNNRLIKLENEVIKKDDLEWRKVVEKVDKVTNDVTEIKTELKNLENSMNKTIDSNKELGSKTEVLSANLGKTDVTSLALKDTVDRFIKASEDRDKDMSNDLKELTGVVNKLNIDSTANTDFRKGFITNKAALYIGIATTVLGLYLGSTIK